MCQPESLFFLNPASYSLNLLIFIIYLLIEEVKEGDVVKEISKPIFIDTQAILTVKMLI